MLNQDLQMGDHGNDVRILQEKLKILGFYPALINGDFGLATEAGVKAFQKEYSLPETGIVDEEMWELLFSLTEVAYSSAFSKYPTLSLGMSGEEVRDLQTKLKTLLYYTGEINSLFDTATQTAVKRFQFHNNLTTTGVVNNQTWSILDTLYGNINECVIEKEENKDNVHIVVKGDTLYSIARRYNTTVDAIRRLNQLTSDVLSIGQVLKIPSSSSDNGTIPSTTYTVQPGDTLYSIARRYNTTVDAIRSLNNLSSNVLSVGQVLRIPSSNQNTPQLTHTVQPGETLFSIARRYNTAVDAIKSLNNLSSNVLSIGQVLRIPSNENSPQLTHTVQPGETLFSIARRYNTAVDAIKSLNNLSSNVLSIGQVLRIPSNENSPQLTHTVQPGETLFSIARRYNTTVDTIKRLNNLTSNVLSIGQILRIA